MERGDIVFKTIDGLTIENRAAQLKAIPDDVLDELKQCHVILKAPTTTPRAGDPWPNIESANVAMRRALDLFANVRPVKIPAQGIDWTFFRENTEGAYVMGSRGIHVTEDLAFDFTAVTSQGSERIIEMAFDYARTHDKKRVTVVTKANVIKTTDGKFLETARSIAARYPEIEWDDWYIDIIPAKLVDPKRRSHFRVVVLPNLYGDILTDEAAELQGGVGTAGSANIGRHYAMFEAIHGSAPRMVEEGRVEYADPSGLIRAGAMLLNHIGFSRPRPPAGDGARNLRHVREEDGRHRPPDRRQGLRVHRLPPRDAEGPASGGALARLPGHAAGCSVLVDGARIASVVGQTSSSKLFG